MILFMHISCNFLFFFTAAVIQSTFDQSLIDFLLSIYCSNYSVFSYICVCSGVCQDECVPIFVGVFLHVNLKNAWQKWPYVYVIVPIRLSTANASFCFFFVFSSWRMLVLRLFYVSKDEPSWKYYTITKNIFSLLCYYSDITNEHQANYKNNNCAHTIPRSYAPVVQWNLMTFYKIAKWFT